MTINETAIPKWLTRKLLAAYRNSTSYDGWFPVHDEKANARLCELFGLTTDYTEHYIGNAFRVRFCWAIQRWYVG